MSARGGVMGPNDIADALEGRLSILNQAMAKLQRFGPFESPGTLAVSEELRNMAARLRSLPADADLRRIRRTMEGRDE